MLRLSSPFDRYRYDLCLLRGVVWRGQICLCFGGMCETHYSILHRPHFHAIMLKFCTRIHFDPTQCSLWKFGGLGKRDHKPPEYCGSFSYFHYFTFNWGVNFHTFFMITCQLYYRNVEGWFKEGPGALRGHWWHLYWKQLAREGGRSNGNAAQLSHSLWFDYWMRALRYNNFIAAWWSNSF